LDRKASGVVILKIICPSTDERLIDFVGYEMNSSQLVMSFLRYFRCFSGILGAIACVLESKGNISDCKNLELPQKALGI